LTHTGTIVFAYLDEGEMIEEIDVRIKGTGNMTLELTWSGTVKSTNVGTCLEKFRGIVLAVFLEM
jgi:hypothetical protein